MKQSLNFTIEGEFITNLAREKFQNNHDLSSAIELLMTALVTDELSYNERLILALKILDGKAELKGTYPGDYHLIMDDNVSEKLDLSLISDTIKSAYSALGQAEHDRDNALSKLSFIEYNMLDYQKQDLNNSYYSEMGENLFETDTASNELKSVLSKMHDYNAYTYPDYGWLDTNGKYHPVEWGQHSEWAGNWLMKNCSINELEEIEHFKERSDIGPKASISNSDILVYYFGWVLVHNPAMGTSEITYDRTCGITQAQKRFLYAFFKERNLKTKMTQINDMTLRKEPTLYELKNKKGMMSNE